MYEYSITTIGWTCKYKAKSIGMISFPLTVFTVFVIKTCTDFFLIFSDQGKN